MRCKPRPFARPRRLATLRLGAFPRRVEETWRPLSSIAMLATVVFLFAAPTAQAARSEFFGVIQGPPLDDPDFDAITPTGVKTARFLLPWMLIEKEPRPARLARDGQGGRKPRLARDSRRSHSHLARRPGSERARTGPPLNNGSAKRAWKAFLKAAVARYGPGGSYWTNDYRQKFGEGVAPVPIRSWQIWNEPNLREWPGPGPFLFAPGATVKQVAQLYGQLLHISHDAITSEDPQAKIVTAGFLTQKDPYVFDFIDSFYSMPGIKGDFDAIAQHDYAASLDQVGALIKGVRKVMAHHGDQATPLWITEIGWGSAPPDGAGINLGPEGQASMLTRSFKLILTHRSAWNVQRLFWYDWRNPPPGSPYAGVCIRCGSAGLLTYDGSPKPAYDAFVAFTAETTPPLTSISGGPSEGGFTKDPTPRFFFSSSEAGSTFACRIDAGALSPCASPYTAPTLSQGPHGFSVEAIDAAGNESSVVTRSFTVETSAPQTTIDSGPSGATNDPTPTFRFTSSEPGSSFRCRLDSGSL